MSVPLPGHSKQDGVCLSLSQALTKELPKHPERQLSAAEQVPEPCLTLIVSHGLSVNQTLISKGMDWASPGITKMALGSAGCLSSLAEPLSYYPEPQGLIF